MTFVTATFKSKVIRQTGVNQLLYHFLTTSCLINKYEPEVTLMEWGSTYITPFYLGQMLVLLNLRRDFVTCKIYSFYHFFCITIKPLIEAVPVQEAAPRLWENF